MADVVNHEHKYMRIEVTKADGSKVAFVPGEELRTEMTDSAEPVFLLRAQDVFAEDALRAYVDVLLENGEGGLAGHAEEHADEFSGWPYKKTPD